MNPVLRGALLLVALAGPAARRVAAQGAECTCVADFDMLAQKVAASYVGHALYVTGDRRAAYDSLVRTLRARAASVPAADCVLVLRELTDWFGDGHLFIAERPQVSADSTAKLDAAVERDGRAPAALQRDLESRRRRLDPIEGIWYDKAGTRVAVVRDSSPAAFVAVVIADSAKRWAPGQVVARFARRPDGGYAAAVLGDDRLRRRYTGRIHRGTLLHMPPLTWGREWPRPANAAAALDARDPRAPMLHVLDTGHVLLSVPSHAPEYRARLESLLVENAPAIERARTLVIDLRGNEGGSSPTTRALMPLLHTREQRPALGPTGPPAILVSEENLAWFKRAGAPDSLLAPYANRVGEVVEVPSPNGAAAVDTTPELPMPARVAILVDRGVVSAAEAFLLAAKRSTKVTVYGERTGGVIDLQNVRLTRLACSGRGLLLGYPTMAASARLPEGGLNATGIVPDVRVPADAADPIAFVMGHERRSASRATRR